MNGWNTINLPQYQTIPKLFPALQPHEYIEKKNNALEDGFAHANGLAADPAMLLCS